MFMPSSSTGTLATLAPNWRKARRVPEYEYSSATIVSPAPGMM